MDRAACGGQLRACGCGKVAVGGPEGGREHQKQARCDGTVHGGEVQPPPDCCDAEGSPALKGGGAQQGPKITPWSALVFFSTGGQSFFWGKKL